MPNRNDKPKVAAENKQNAQSSIKAESSSKKTGRFYKALLFVIVVIALALAIYAAMISFNTQKTTEQKFTNYRDEFSTFNLNHTKALSSLQSQTDLEQKVTQQNQEKIQTLNKKFHVLAEQNLHQSDAWRLFKARYYLELAQVNAHWSHETNATIALLKQADHMLANFHDQAIYTLREAISGDIAELKAQKQVDMPGILSQLNAAQKQVANLKLETPTPKTLSLQQPSKPNTVDPSKSAWREKLQNSIHLLEKLVVVRHQDDTSYPFLDNHQLAIVRANIELQLQQAQWAVLHQEQKIFEMSLIQASKSIQRAFQTNQKAAQALLTQLKKLQQIDISPPKANIDESLKLLNQFIETQASQQLQETHRQGESS